MFPLFRNIKSLLGGLSTLSFNLGEAYYSTGNYKTYADNYYSKNPTVYGTVNYISRNIASLRWILYDDDEHNKDRQLILKDPFLDLMRKPDPRMTRTEFFKRICIHYLLAGNVYIYKNMVGNKIKELNILRPDRCRVVGGKLEYILNNGNKTTYEREEIIYLQNYNPVNENIGLSPISATAASVETNNAGRKWNFSLLKNMIKTGTWFETDGEIRDKKGMTDSIQGRFGGADNVGKTMVLKGGLRLKQAGLSPTDMDWVNSQDRSAVEFMFALNFPPELAGKKSSYDNWEQAVKSFWNECALPIAYEIRDSLNSLAPIYGGKYLDIDKEDIDALRDDEDKRNSRTTSRYQGGIITLPEARAELGYAPLEPAERALLYTAPAGSMGLDDFKSISVTPSFSTEEKARARSRYTIVDRNRAKFFKHFEDVTKKQFEKERDRILKMMKNNTMSTLPISLTRVIKEEFIPEWVNNLTEFNVHVLNTIGQSEMNALYAMKKSSKAVDPKKFDPYSDAIQKRVRKTVADKVVGINDRTRRLIKKRIDEGIEEGFSIDEIAENIDELYLDQIIPNRSKVIAQTETISTVNFGSQEVAKQSGLKAKKFWISTMDGKTRGYSDMDEFDHLHMNGVETDVDEPYKEIRSGQMLMYPGDSSLGASAGNVINCRCTEGYKVLD